ncbi:MAG: hypothetical protein ACQCXQ_15415 [Verrucomicrobiales bacterium]
MIRRATENPPEPGEITEEIEVEVVEIDGIAPVRPGPRPAATDDPASMPNDWQSWQQWQGRIKRLDSRWWPLWTLLGIIAITLILTVGLVIGAIYLVFSIIRAVLRALFS